MAKVLDSKIYVNGGYLDNNISVSNISELLEKENSNAFFLGQSVYMPIAFESSNGAPYPIDFWSVPNGEYIKWEIKTIPAIESLTDLDSFKNFVEQFKTELGYYPMADGFEFLVDGAKYLFRIDENGISTYIEEQTKMDSLIADTVENAVEEAVNKVTSGASEAFDTLKEIEEWINSNSGATDNVELLKDVENLKKSAHTHDNKDILDVITSDKIEAWDKSSQVGGTFIDEDIKVTNETGSYKNGMVIEEGTSLLEVLKNFLTNTYYPSKATLPTAEMVLDGEVLGDYEIGTSIELPKITIETVDGKFNYNDYEGVLPENGKFTELLLKREVISGFDGFQSDEEFVNSPINSESVVVSEGVNEIILRGIAKYQAPTNKPTDSNGEVYDGAESTWQDGVIEMEKTIRVNGYRKIYYGTTNENVDITEQLLNSLKVTDKLVDENDILYIDTKEIFNHNRMIIAVPESKTLQLVEDSTSTQDLTKLLLIKEKKIEILDENRNESVIYNVYDKSWAGSFGNETWKIKIKNN